MNVYLDEQLNQIYLTEDIMKYASAIKGKAKNIVQAFENGNLLKVKSILNSMPDMNIEELSIAAKKKGKTYYNEGMRIVKGEKTIQQKAFCIVYSSVKATQAALPDASKESLEEPLEKLREFAAQNAGKFASEGLGLFVIMWFISFFVYGVPIIWPLVHMGMLAGVILFWFGILLFVIKILLNTYFSLRGKSKV